MANVSQQIPNFLGGVSQASDIQKDPNQVDEIINGLPDATYGLLKRPGSQWLYNLDVDDPEDWYWFTIQRKGTPYIGCIKDGELRLWSSTTGVEQNVDITALGDYLDAAPSGIPNVTVPAYEQFEIFPLEKGVVILNKRKVTARSSDTSPAATVEEVTSFADLPDAGDSGTVYHILNTPIAEDDYYVEWNGSAYVETIEPEITYKLDPSTLPHGLAYTGVDEWTAGPLTYTERQSGNDKTNPFPSFVGLTINSVFAYMNRFGFIAGSNVVMSQPLTPVNDIPGQVQPLDFFAVSAFTVSEADPVDISVASVRDVVLYSQQASRQGIVLFGGAEQFLLYSTDQIISPSTAMVRSLSTWEMNFVIPPVELDSEFFFVSGRAPLNEHARLIKMTVRGMEEDPICTDVSKPVSDWIPSKVFQLEASTQEQFISIVEKDSSQIYFYRYFKDAGELVMKAWFKWQYESGTKVIYHTVVNSNLYIILKTPDNKVSANFTQLTANVSDEVFSNDVNSVPQPFIDLKPSMDLYARVESVALVGGKSQLTMATGYPEIDVVGSMPFVVVAENDIPRNLQYRNIEAGFAAPLVYNSTTGKYETVDRLDLTADADKLVMGFLYKFEVTLPTLYFRQEITDYAARLNIARCKFQCSAGLQGALSFELRSRGYEDFDVTYEVTPADDYEASTVPLVRTKLFEVPINRLNRYYTLKSISESPYPIAMNSMTWEGNYSPRFYRRL